MAGAGVSRALPAAPAPATAWAAATAAEMAARTVRGVVAELELVGVAARVDLATDKPARVMARAPARDLEVVEAHREAAEAVRALEAAVEAAERATPAATSSIARGHRSWRTASA